NSSPPYSREEKISPDRGDAEFPRHSLDRDPLGERQQSLLRHRRLRLHRSSRRSMRICQCRPSDESGTRVRQSSVEADRVTSRWPSRYPFQPPPTKCTISTTSPLASDCVAYLS